MKQLVFILFFAFLNPVNAQNDVSFDDLVRSYREFRDKEPSKALEYALQAKSLAVVQGDTKQLSLADYYIATCEMELEQNKTALTHIESAIAQATTINDTLLLYKYLFIKGSILSKLGDDSKAIKVYMQSKNYAKGNSVKEIASLCEITLIKKLHKDFEEAIALYKDILKRLSALTETRDTKYYRLIALVGITDTYLRMQNTVEAKVYNEIGLKNSSKNQNARAYYSLLMNKAIIQYQETQYNASIVLTKQVEAYAEGKDESLYVTSLFYLGKNAYKLKSYTESILQLEKTYAVMKASENVYSNEKELHEFLTAAYTEEKNTEKASYHLQQYTALEKKQSAEDLKLNNEMHALVDIVPLKTKIHTLDKQLTQESKSKKGYIITSIGLLLVLISSVFYYRARNKRVQKKFAVLLQKVSALEKDKKEKVETQKDTVSDEKIQAILKKLAKFEKNETYLSKDCSLGVMAEALETNTAYLSKVINTYKGKSFTAYITELRIETALVNLKNNKKLQSYTIMAIADEFGFKRQETFSRAFKLYTGIYPSQYIRNLKEKS
ncbi:AraC family transcriptional regulator [uncultured Kordia sp.]|uniref:helix-turn-helix domain-containing protein n=1 Tax=uncultured Kordia sp. TaxID=507699 RepID=UPI00262F05A7|nr:helix-turn-helix domain-containing protein [uncultured Kordia sp.]